MMFIDDFEVILFDQGKTFIFQNDRFGPEVDYHSIYRSLGGNRLSSGEVYQIMERLYIHMLESSHNSHG